MVNNGPFTGKEACGEALNSLLYFASLHQPKRNNIVAKCRANFTNVCTKKPIINRPRPKRRLPKDAYLVLDCLKAAPCRNLESLEQKDGSTTICAWENAKVVSNTSHLHDLTFHKFLIDPLTLSSNFDSELGPDNS
jgi:hypothetical protein